MISFGPLGEEKEIFCMHGQHMRPASEMRYVAKGKTKRWICVRCVENIKQMEKEAKAWQRKYKTSV